MQRSFASALLFSAVIGMTACSKEEPEGAAEQMGKKIDETAESIKQEAGKAAEATQEKADETKAAVGAALEETGKEMQGEGK